MYKGIGKAVFPVGLSLIIEQIALRRETQIVHLARRQNLAVKRSPNIFERLTLLLVLK